MDFKQIFLRTNCSLDSLTFLFRVSLEILYSKKPIFSDRKSLKYFLQNRPKFPIKRLLYRKLPIKYTTFGEEVLTKFVPRNIHDFRTRDPKKIKLGQKFQKNCLKNPRFSEDPQKSFYSFHNFQSAFLLQFSFLKNRMFSVRRSFKIVRFQIRSSLLLLILESS